MSEPYTSPFTPIADAILAHVNSGTQSDEPLWDAHYDPDFESVEQDGSAAKGRANVLEKHKWWYGNHTVYSIKSDGHFFGPTGFGIIWEVDMEAKDGSFPRMKGRELAIYTIENGKVIREEFWAAPMG